jgi:choline-sulfatase
LFDVKTHPNERINLAGAEFHAKPESNLRTQVLARWDADHIADQIRLSQWQRKLTLKSDRNGKRTRWNHGETLDSVVIWYRGKGSYNEWAFDFISVADT